MVTRYPRIRGLSAQRASPHVRERPLYLSMPAHPFSAPWGPIRGGVAPFLHGLPEAGFEPVAQPLVQVWEQMAVPVERHSDR